ncbi:AGAP003695-PA-like protein [Anopheles sinensis]|uniref:Aminopeptidase n=1 Tax=Anopheles sinensis TaxID=74873 RepID=A0A084WR45_ANOSI|nr:AGAP003695-PA-like protein [Anopheles sinensis]
MLVSAGVIASHSASVNTIPNRIVNLVDTSSVQYRLDNASEPLSYDLFLDLTDENFLVYSGAVDITIRYLSSESYGFVINSVGLMVDESSLRLTRSDGKLIPVDQQMPVQILSEFEQIHLKFAEILEKGTVYTVHLAFSGNIRSDFFKGLYRSSYRVNGQERYLATTFFAAAYARTVFPCYDEPGYKASYTIKIRHRPQHMALSNMPASGSVQVGENMETSFEPTPLMSTYLVAFVVSDFQTASSSDELIRVYAPENKVSHTQYARDFAVRSLRTLETYFGRQSQVPKIDLVAIPDFAMGAMENWGMITFREDYLIYEDEYNTTAMARQSIAAVVTHELVHMWFGNEVTPEWWTYVWLNEGFARYFEYYITSQLEPSWNLWEQFITTNVHSALSQDCHSSTRPMNYYATDPSFLNEIYDYVVYAKSASVIRMIQNVIGLDTFKMAINEYLQSRSYLTTKPQYLYASIEKFRTVELPASVEAIFESWANAPGYPVVTVTVDLTQRTLKASQKRFWMPNEIDSPPKNELFYVPINYASSVSKDFDITAPTFWLTPSTPEVTVSIESDINWLVANKQQTGYYRVNYDEASWNRLVGVLNSDRFDTDLPVINRAQLVDDVANLARAGEVGYDVALSLMQYLERETEYIPWSTAYNALLYLDRMFSGNKEYKRFESYARKLLSHVFNETKAIGSTDHQSRLHRDKTLYLACYYGVAECLTQATVVLQTAIQGESLDVPKEIQSGVFCAFHKYAPLLDASSELMILQKFIEGGDQLEELMKKYITSMGCSRLPLTIDFYLQMVEVGLPGLALSRTMQRDILASMIKGGPASRNASLKYMLDRFVMISTALNGQLSTAFDAFGSSINTRAEYQMVRISGDPAILSPKFFILLM